jgi:hypothetical protein
MKRYKFLIKPLFYIFCLTGSSYMVLVIEKISPSDFSKHQTLFISTPKNIQAVQVKYDRNKDYLKSICFDYKYGVIDSATLDEKLNQFLYGTDIQPQPAPQIASISAPRKILLQRIND